MSELEKLTDVFQRLGALDPEGWASSQVDEGINQLGRFVFLRQAWKQVIDENDPGWIDNLIESAKRRPDDPYSGAGHALSKLKTMGVDSETITDLVRGTQAELLFSFCYLLGDPGDLPTEVSHMAWGLFEIDDEGQPIAPIDSLHESVLETDPTGREMRPRRR